LKFPRKGFPTYGEAIGIIMQKEVGWPRIPGDVGNAFSFGFPVKYKAVKGFGVKEIVTPNPTPRAEKMLVDAAVELESEGVRAIVGGVGYMIIFQEALANAVDIPVFSSSLLLTPIVSRTLAKGKRVGILTINAKALTERHLKCAGLDESMAIAIQGLDSLPEEMARYQNRLDPEERLKTMENNLTYAAERMVSEYPDLGALIFECTCFPPAAPAVQKATGLPIYDVVTLANFAHDVVVKTRFPVGHRFM